MKRHRRTRRLRKRLLLAAGFSLRWLKDILAEGFLIRTTVLVPAEAVTRQIGKVSSGSVLLTLQKETAIAVCYYTLKAYVKEGLTDIASCTVFR